MNKKKEQSEQTKKKVAETARNLFALKGYAATSIEDIVAATGSSKGNIYYHFQSKEGLFLHLLDEWDREWKEQWAAQEHLYTTLEEKLYGLAEHLVLNDLNHPLTKAMDEFLNKEWERSEIRERAANFYQEHIQFNQDLLQEGMDTGVLKADDARTLGLILEALLIGLAEISKHATVFEEEHATLAVYRKSMQIFFQGTALQQ